MACRVHTCCGCCSVRVGAIIVGVLYLIFAVAVDIVLAVIDIVAVFIAAPPSNVTPTTPSDNLTNGTGGNSTDDDTDIEDIPIATWVELGIDVVFFIICILLIIGAAKNNRVLCMIWLVAAGLWTALMAGDAVQLTVRKYQTLGNIDVQLFLDTLITKWAALVLWLFMLIVGAVVVSSHVADIRDDKEGLLSDERSYPT